MPHRRRRGELLPPFTCFESPILTRDLFVREASPRFLSGWPSDQHGADSDAATPFAARRTPLVITKEAPPTAGQGYTGRRMPSLRMRAWSVVRFMPSSAAAPLGPAMRHCVCLSARKMCWRSASSRVEIEEAKEAEEATGEEALAPETAAEPEPSLSSESGMRSSFPGESSTARSTRFSSSRTLPGQE